MAYRAALSLGQNDNIMSLPNLSLKKATELSASPGSFFADQFNNPDAASGYASMAEEIWHQSGRKVDALVQSLGTAQCITGIAGALRKPKQHGSYHCGRT